MSHAALSTVHDDYNRDEKVFASSSAAYLIGKRYGYEPADFDPEMIQDFVWPNDPVIIRAALNDARQAANMVCQRIDRGLDSQHQGPASVGQKSDRTDQMRACGWQMTIESSG